nr:polysaccharide pyruvyl transferase family protein [uncultured Acetatifactor sp.]
MNLRRILPLEVNLEIRNFLEYFKRKTISTPKNRERKRLLFLDAASYGNMGDQAIAYAISLFLKTEFPDFEYIEVSENELLCNFREIKEGVSPHDIICLSGGGNMGDMYPRYEALRRKIIRNFPENRIFIFPQTIDYSVDNYGKHELERSIKIYNAHTSLFIFAREKKSVSVMRGIYKNVYLAPDMAFYLKGKIIPENTERGSAVGVCLRNDRESTLTREEQAMLMEQAEKVGGEVLELSTIGQLTHVCQTDRFEALRNKLKEFSQCKLIITDRLHGMAFSILLCIPCIIIDNLNQKLSGVLETVENYVYNVRIIDKKEFELIPNIFHQIRNAGYNQREMHDMYDGLIQEIRTLVN